MSAILATALFASYAAAQLSTSIWLPGAANANVSFVASVIEQNGDKTTLSLDFAEATATEDEYYGEAPATVTVGGATYAAYQAVASDIFGEDDTAVTVSLGCSRADTKAVPTCTMTTKGLDVVISQLCSAAKTESHATPMEYDPYCSNGSKKFTTDATLTFSGESQYYINQFPLVITAGTEKLSSAAASPTGSSALSSASGSASPASVSGSGSPSNTASASRSPISTGSVSPSAASASVAEQSTAGAAPLMTMVPALAGLGAAAAAIFL